MSKFIYCIFIAVLGIGSISCQNISSTENDLKVLNYALTLEHLEATFYNTFQNKYSSDDFNSAGLDPHLYDYLSVIQSHENAHVQALTQTIQQLGGTPVEQCNYNFDMVNDPASYLATAKLLENTGQGAYDGALNHLSNVQLQAVAASIATVEARHAAFLNKVLGDVPFPNATDPAYTPEEVVNAVKPFFRDCAGSTDFTPLVSTIRPNGVTGAPAAAIPENINIPQNNAQYTTEQKQNDLKVLNYALTLEHLEANFYNQFQARYDVNAFRAAGFSDTDYSYVTLISAHENAHVQALQGTISAYGGSPVPECKYNFSGVTDVQSYIATAKVLENVGVSAYNGAANLITDVILQQVAATIDTVEGRHAAFLNLLVNGTEADAPFPSATDEGVAPANILKAAAGFISSCPYDINDANSLPGPAPAGSSQPTPNNPTPTNNNSAVSFYPSSFSMLSIFFLLASLLI